jgi:hypothetical protein
MLNVSTVYKHVVLNSEHLCIVISNILMDKKVILYPPSGIIDLWFPSRTTVEVWLFRMTGRPNLANIIMLFQKPLMNGIGYGPDRRTEPFSKSLFFFEKAGDKTYTMCLITTGLFGINCGRQFIMPTKMTSFQPIHLNTSCSKSFTMHDR